MRGPRRRHAAAGVVSAATSSQDYLFLIQFARAYALAAYKAPTLAAMRAAAAGMTAILDTELKLHVRLVERWGHGRAQLEAHRGGARDGRLHPLRARRRRARRPPRPHVALSPCVIGYAEIGRTCCRRRASGRSKTNPYRDWITEYAGDAYQALARDAEAGTRPARRRRLTEARYPRLLALFRKATRLEADFWQMGLAVAE